MVVSGRINKVAFYARMNYTRRDYKQYLPVAEALLNQRFGEKKWEMKVFYEIASGVDPEREQFLRLKAEIQAGKVDMVVTIKAATIARDWKQFIGFMELCKKHDVPVIFVDDSGDAQSQYEVIRRFQQEYSGEGETGHEDTDYGTKAGSKTEKEACLCLCQSLYGQPEAGRIPGKPDGIL